MTAGWVDTHTHLQDARIEDPSSMWESARQVGIARTLLAGVDRNDWARQEALSHLSGVYFSAGLHPQRVAELTSAEVTEQFDALKVWLSARADGRRWVALGEIGLDAVGERRSALALQCEAFAAQLELARRLELPVILHVLRAHEEALSILRRVGVPAAGGVVHSYSGSKELVPKYLDLGLYLSFGGAITWAPQNRAAEALRVCPLDRLLLETDAPDQTPLGKRPSQNEPSFLLEVAAVAARAKSVSEAELRAKTTANAERLFGFEKHVVESGGR